MAMTLRAVRSARPAPIPVVTARPMPRFRKSARRGITLTELVRTVLNRAQTNGQPFGVFLFAGQRAVLCGAHTARFQSMIERYPGALVGAYDARLTVTDLIGDLQGFFEIGRT